MEAQEISEKLANLLNRDDGFHVNSKNEIIISITNHIHVFSIDEAKEIIKEFENIVMKSELGVPPTIIEKIMYYIFSENSL